MSASDWRSRSIAAYSLGVGVLGWLLLIRSTHWGALSSNLRPLLLFSVLSLIVKRFGVHISRDVTHSLVGVADLAAVLSLGPVPGAWAAVLSGLAYLELRALRHRLFSWRVMGEHPIFSSGLKALLALGCGTLYLHLGGAIPPSVVNWPMLIPFAATVLAWFVLDHLGWAVRVFLRSGIAGAVAFLQSILPYSILMELLPTPLAIVIALAYEGEGAPVFLMLCLALVASGVLIQRFSQVDARLKERVTELTVLNDLGRRLVEARLDVDQMGQLLCEYAAKVVRAGVVRLELLQPNHDAVDVVVHTESGELQPRRTLPMTESMRWMASRREPFLSNDVPREGLPFHSVPNHSTGSYVESGGTSQHGPPRSLLMLPLLARQQLIGLLSVHSDETYAFDEDVLRVLAAMTNQTAIAIENARLYQASLEQQRISEELRLAREIQVSFLPECCPYYPGYEFAADWHAARGVGGDFYDFIRLGDGYVGLVIADVSDKGMPAAMFMSMSRTLVRASAGDPQSPARTLQRVNELITADMRSGMFVTIFYGVLELTTGALTYACAGHNPPLLWHARTSQASTLAAKGVALGVMPNVSLEQRQTRLDAGDILILYTDGVTEPINDKEEEFGEERLAQAVAQVSHKPSTDIIEFIRAAVGQFVGDQPQFDDYTLVVVKRQK